MSFKEIASKKDLITQLLKIPLREVDSVKEKGEILEYLLNAPRSLLDASKSLRYFHRDWMLEAIPWAPEAKREAIRDYLIGIAVEDARKDFYVYAKLMASIVLPNDFIDGRHIKKICQELQAVAESIDSKGLTKRSMFFLPPGAMKTILCSILFPSWVYGLHPNWQVIAVGYNDEFAQDKIGQPLRELMFSKEYRSLFPETIIRGDSRSKDRFVTTKKGEFKALGARARAAGRRAHLLICDDTVSEKDAWSDQLRGEINKNYIGGLRSRLMRTPRGAEIIVNTRYSLDDLSGFLMRTDADSKRPWKVLKIPAILDEEGSKILRERNDPEGLYAPGTSFWPEMQPMDVLQEEREALLKTEPYKWHALYMQNPTPVEGNIIKHDDWQWWSIEDKGTPKVSHVLISMDTAFSEKERADYSAYTVWGSFYPEGSEGVPHLILLKAEKGHWDWPTLLEKAVELKYRWKPDFFIIEKKASGQSLLQDLYRKGFPVVEFDPRSKKTERLQSASIWFRQGRIWVPEGKDWALDLVEEVNNFPSGSHDDLVDTVSQAIIWYRDMGVVEHSTVDDDHDEDTDISPGSPGGTSYWQSLLRVV